jgi:hypothetical protein
MLLLITFSILLLVSISSIAYIASSSRRSSKIVVRTTFRDFDHAFTQFQVGAGTRQKVSRDSNSLKPNIELMDESKLMNDGKLLPENRNVRNFGHLMELHAIPESNHSILGSNHTILGSQPKAILFPQAKKSSVKAKPKTVEDGSSFHKNKSNIQVDKIISFADPAHDNLDHYFSSLNISISSGFKARQESCYSVGDHGKCNPAACPGMKSPHHFYSGFIRELNSKSRDAKNRTRGTCYMCSVYPKQCIVSREYRLCC